MPKKKEIAAPERPAHHGDVVKEVEAGLTRPELLAEMAGLFKVLSDPTRLKIVNALLLAEMCVCDITAMMRIPQPSVSHHLKELRLARLVKCRKNGKEIHYSLNDYHIQLLFDLCKTHSAEQMPKGEC